MWILYELWTMITITISQNIILHSYEDNFYWHFYFNFVEWEQKQKTSNISEPNSVLFRINHIEKWKIDTASPIITMKCLRKLKPNREYLNGRIHIIFLVHLIVSRTMRLIDAQCAEIRFDHRFCGGALRAIFLVGIQPPSGVIQKVITAMIRKYIWIRCGSGLFAMWPTLTDTDPISSSCRLWCLSLRRLCRHIHWGECPSARICTEFPSRVCGSASVRRIDEMSFISMFDGAWRMVYLPIWKSRCAWMA